MPVLEIFTNVSKDKVTKELNVELANLVANLLGKPLGFVAVHLVPDQQISFGGTFDPYAYGSVMSIGKLGVEENKKLSSEIMSLLENKLGVSPSRCYLVFKDEKASNVGWNKSTFHGMI